MRYTQEAGGVSRPEPSFIDVDTGNGYGSGAANIRKFSNVEDRSGYAIQYISDSVAGDSFRIKEGGVFSIVYTDADNTGSFVFGISLNADTTVSIGSLPIARRTNGRTGRLSSTVPLNGIQSQSSWIGPLYPGDVIRAHTNNGTTSTSAQVRFIITKISN